MSTSAFGHIFDEELRVSSSRKKKEGAMGSHCNTFLKGFKPGKKLDEHHKAIGWLICNLSIKACNEILQAQW